MVKLSDGLMRIYYTIVSTSVFMLENFHNKKSKMHMIFKKNKKIVVMSKCVSPVPLPVLSTWSSVLVLLGMVEWINNIENCVSKSLPGDLGFLRIFNIDCRKPRASDKVWLAGEGTFYFLVKDWFLWDNRSTSGTLS